MRQSFREYVSAMGRWGWLVLVDILFAAASAYLDISGKWRLPSWVWITMLGVAVLVVPFIAFHKVRVQRDNALRSKTDAVANRIIAISNYGYEFETLDNGVRLQLNPEIHAIPGVRIEDIQLEMKGKRYDTDWKPMTEAISGDIGESIDVNLPKSLKSGTYRSRIVVIIENREHYSDIFDLNYQKPSLDKGDSQT